MRKILASKNPAYYVCLRIERILRKLRKSEPETTEQLRALTPDTFQAQTPVFKAIDGTFNQNP